jgi:hypothetical protein
VSDDEESVQQRKIAVIIVIDDDTDEDRHVGKRKRLVQGRAPVYENFRQ